MSRKKQLEQHNEGELCNFHAAKKRLTDEVTWDLFEHFLEVHEKHAPSTGPCEVEKLFDQIVGVLAKSKTCDATLALLSVLDSAVKELLDEIERLEQENETKRKLPKAA